MRIRTALAGIAIALPGVAVLTAGTTEAAPAAPAHDLCQQEDGSGQRLCVWDAVHQGNGAGRSFVAINGGTDRGRYVYVSHVRAHRLTH